MMLVSCKSSGLRFPGPAPCNLPKHVQSQGFSLKVPMHKLLKSNHALVMKLTEL